MTQFAPQQGMIEVEGGKVWYALVGAGGGTPLVTLHGGPGFPHNSLAPLADLADDRPVLFYDQLGCGKSERPSDAGLWRIERFVEELVTVCDALELERIHLFGHSWGTALAVDFCLGHPERIDRIILASPMLSASRWKQDGGKHVRALPHVHQIVIAQHDAGDECDKDAFARAEAEYLRRHFCRLDPWPDEMKQAGAGFGGDVYHAMWGHCEWHPSGSLASYERIDRLADIRAPVLLTCGRYDEATPETTDLYGSCMADARVKVFERSSHVAHFEDRVDYILAVRKFLDLS